MFNRLCTVCKVTKKNMKHAKLTSLKIDKCTSIFDFMLKSGGGKLWPHPSPTTFVIHKTALVPYKKSGI